MKKSKSISILNEDFKEIYTSILSLGIYTLSNAAFFKNASIMEELTDSDKEIFQNVRNFENNNYLFNSLYISVVAVLETYLKNRLIEELEKYPLKCEQLILKYNIGRHYTAKDILDGPKKVAREILDSIIFHNLPKVNTIYKIIFSIDILAILQEKRVFEIIKIRHKIVHQSGRINDMKIFVREYALLSDMTILNKWLQDIDGLSVAGAKRNTNVNFLHKYLKTVSKYYDTPIFQDGISDLVQNDVNKMDEIFNENSFKKKQIQIT